MLDMYPERYKINGKYEFLLNYPEISGQNDLSYNRWRQSLSPTTQTQNKSQKNSDDHYVPGYEANQSQIGFTTKWWGGLALSNNERSHFIDGSINRVDYWHYAIGSYGTEYRGYIPGPLNAQNEKIVELYTRVKKHYVNLGNVSCDPMRKERFASIGLYIFIFIEVES